MMAMLRQESQTSSYWKINMKIFNTINGFSCQHYAFTICGGMCKITVSICVVFVLKFLSKFLSICFKSFSRLGDRLDEVDDAESNY
jgi:hypothetical protein